jgi:hypothetical protein
LRSAYQAGSLLNWTAGDDDAVARVTLHFTLLFNFTLLFSLYASLGSP